MAKVKLKINSLLSETEKKDGTSAIRTVLNSLPFHIFLIILLPLLAYSNTFDVPFQFDDIINIKTNPIIKDFSYILEPSKAKGLPLGGGLSSRWTGYLTFAMNYKYNGLNALLLYAMVILSFCTPFLKRSLLKESSAYIALFTALMFVSHPIQTQAVTYIVQRFASLATFFYLAAIVCYIKSRLLTENPWRYFFYVLSLISAILAMKTKGIAFTLPVVIVLYEFLFLEGTFRKRFFYLFPFLLTMLIIPITLLGIDKPIGEMIGNVNEATRVKTDMSRWDYLFTQFAVIVTYIRLLFFPINQNLDYDYPIYHTFFTPKVSLSFLLLLSIFGFGVYMFFRSRTRSRSTRLVAFGIFWFFIALSVESSIIPIVDVIFEHRVYLSSVGVSLALASGIFLLLNKFDKKVQTVGIGIFCTMIMILSGAAYSRNHVWRSEISLWSDCVAKSPNKVRPHNNLGDILKKHNHIDEAMNHFLRALQIDPEDADAHNNLGVVIAERGEYDKAIDHYLQALRIKPDSHRTHRNLGNALYKQGRIDKAIDHYLRALRIKPDSHRAHNNLGNALYKQGRIDKAIDHYLQALRIKPDSHRAHNNLGNALYKQGRIDKAIDHYLQALRIKPDFDEAHFNLGLALVKQGRIDKAINHYLQALQIKPDFAEVHNSLGIAFYRKGNIEGAIAHFRKALRIKPEYVSAKNNLKKVSMIQQKNQ
jgi:tetratricopeptide (TPR) repeat protein